MTRPRDRDLYAAPRATYSAEIVEDKPYDPCESSRERTILVITDLGYPGTRSVTNDIENVLRECRDRYGLDLPVTVIYRDTQGRWDGVYHLEGTFRGFYPLGETDRAAAIAKATGPQSPMLSERNGLNAAPGHKLQPK
jgi:hypothetical protein